MVVSIPIVRRSKSRPWPAPAAIVWLVWKRNRIALSVAASWLIVLAVLAQTVLHGVLAPINNFWDTPSDSSTNFGPLNWNLIGPVSGVVLLSLFYGVLPFAFSFALYPTPSGPNSSTPDPDACPYPMHLLRTPANSVQLAVCPVVLTMLAIAGFWLFADVAILGPLGIDAPMTTPAVGLALLSGWVLAFFWMPLSAVAKVYAFCPYFGAIAAVYLLCQRIPGNALLLTCAALAVACTLLAVAGLNRCRCGDLVGLTWPAAQLRLEASFDRPTPKLPSAIGAVQSLEWRETSGNLPKALVSAGMRTAAIAAAYTVVICLVVLFVWIILPGYDGKNRAMLGVLLLRHAGAGYLGKALLCAIVWIIWIFRLRIVGFVVSLSGNPSYGGANMLVDLPFFMLPLAFAPQTDAFSDAMALRYCVYLIAAVKIVVGLCVLGLSLKRRLIDWKQFVPAAACWMAAATGLYIVAISLVLSGTIPAGVLGIGVFLAMPLVRLSMGPLLLDRNRHR